MIRRPRWMTAGVAALVISAVFLSPAWAAGTVGAEVDTGVGVVTKLFRGIINAATGWMEIPKQMILQGQDHGPGPAFTWGLIKGVGYAVARSVVGAYEIVTFPMPIPEGYRPIMHPEYVISDIPQREQVQRTR